MKSLFAIFIAICGAVWVYGSLRFYSCIRLQTCDYGFTSPNVEITIMLLGAFVFGYLFGNLLSGLRKRKYIKRSQIDELKGSYTQAKKYGLYTDQKETIVDSKNSEYINTKSILGIDNSSNIDSIYSDNNSDIGVDKYQNKVDSDQNNISNHQSENGSVDIKKKSLFSSFLDDVNLTDETENSKEIKDVDNNISPQKTVKYTSNDSSIRKIHEKNIQQKNEKDDLTKIEGIGPKIAELLNKNEIYTFVDLAKTDPFVLSGILTSAGSRFQMHNPKTWPQQSVYAAKGEWDVLKKYQDKLNGGRV